MSPSHFSPPLFLPVNFSVFLRALRVSVVKSFPCWSWWTLGVLRAASGPPYGLMEDEIRIVEGGP